MCLATLYKCCVLTLAFNELSSGHRQNQENGLDPYPSWGITDTPQGSSDTIQQYQQEPLPLMRVSQPPEVL